MDNSGPLHIIKIITEVFERLGIKYLVGGSFASSFHGIPRATQDIDIVADIKSEQVNKLVKALEGAFYIDEQMVQGAVKQSSSFNIIHLNTMYKVDIFPFTQDKYSKEEMDRREKYKISKDPVQEVYFASAEDIILNKLHWYKIGGEISERQWDDVLGVIKVQHKNLDLDYLKQKAKYLGIEDLLDQALENGGMH